MDQTAFETPSEVRPKEAKSSESAMPSPPPLAPPAVAAPTPALAPTSSRQATSPRSQRTSHSRSTRVLACVLCQHRKIKCDRTSPCSNCTRASRSGWRTYLRLRFLADKVSVSQAGVGCTPSTPAPPRKRRRPHQDLQERLARCEALIKTYTSASNAQEQSAMAAAVDAGARAGAGASSSSSNSPSSTMPTQHASAPTPTPAESAYMHWPPAGKVPSENGTSTFVDSHLWAGIYDEVCVCV